MARWNRTRNAGIAVVALGAICGSFALAQNPTTLERSYCTGLVDTDTGWYREQAPNAPGVGGVPQLERITRQCEVPGLDTDPRKPGPGVMRVELRPHDDPLIEGTADGDVNPSGNSSRAEVYDLFPSTPASGTPWANWPLAQNGGDHVFRLRIYLDPSWVLDSTRWLDVVQFKGYRGGSPPLALAIDGSKFKIVGRRNVFLGAATRGTWHEFTLHIRFRADTTGGLSVEHNGVEYIPWWDGQTMDTYNGAPDPVYLKQGIYRTASWTATHVAYFGPTSVTPAS